MTDDTSIEPAEPVNVAGEDASAAPQKRAASQIDRAKLKEGAKLTGRAVWASVGFLASVGGAIGLFQLFSEPEPKTVGADALLVAMVAEGVITEDQALNLGKVLAGESKDLGEEGAETLEDALEEQDKDAVMAMARMMNSETFTEGLDLLEASAETAEDWLTIAELSWNKDPKRGVIAARKSLELDRTNFRASTLLIQLQAQAGDYTTARRSVESARILAATPLERLMAEKAALNVAMMGAETGDLDDNIERFEQALDIYERSLDAAALRRPIDAEAGSDHPGWITAVSRQTLATAVYYKEDYKAAIAFSNDAIERFEALEPLADETLLRAIKRRKNQELRTVAYAQRADGQLDESYETSLERIANLTAIADEGDASAKESLAAAWGALGYDYFGDGRKEDAKMAYETAASLYSDLIEANPENEELKAAALRVEQIAAYVLPGEGGVEEIKAKRKATIDEVREALISDPFNADNQSDFQSELRASFRVFSSDTETYSDALEALFETTDSTADQIEAIQGVNYYSYLLRGQLAGMVGYMAFKDDDQSAAKLQYERVRDLSDLILTAPNIETYDAEKSGVTLNAIKLSPLWMLAGLEGDDALKSARSGLTLAEGMDAAGQLKTQDRVYIESFRNRIKELEAVAPETTAD